LSDEQTNDDAAFSAAVDEGLLGIELLLDRRPFRFEDAFRAVSAAVHRTARAKGWWDGGDRNFGELVSLMHAELSEALEGMRGGNGPSEHIPAFSAVEEEFADVVIRIMDAAVWNGWDIAGAITAKRRFNEGRPVKHGGKTF